MPGTAVTIGNFDGVHLGHQALLAAARRHAGEDGQVIAMTFDPHPVTVLRPEVETQRLTTLDRRIELLRAAGADHVEVLRVDTAFLSLDPEAFVRDIVLPGGAGRVTTIVEGPDFRFGEGRAGDMALLGELGERYGFGAVVIDPVVVPLADLQPALVRSSLVRWMLGHGRVGDAASLLGRPWCIEGAVVAGDRRGRDLGCPTANLDHADLVLPGDGIYAGVARCPAGTFPAAVSIGDKPTFDGTARICEAHLVGWDGPLDEYGWHLEIDLLRWLRGQVRFDSPDALREQIERDIADVQRCAGGGGGTLRRP